MERYVGGKAEVDRKAERIEVLVIAEDIMRIYRRDIEDIVAAIVLTVTDF